MKSKELTHFTGTYTGGKETSKHKGTLRGLDTSFKIVVCNPPSWLLRIQSDGQKADKNLGKQNSHCNNNLINSKQLPA